MFCRKSQSPGPKTYASLEQQAIQIAIQKAAMKRDRKYQPTTALSPTKRADETGPQRLLIRKSCISFKRLLQHIFQIFLCSQLPNFI